MGRRCFPLHPGVAVFLAGTFLASTGCDDDVTGRLVVVGPTVAELAGVWTGFSRVTDSPDALSMLDRDRTTSFTFPVALTLDEDGGFTLRTVGFSASDGQVDGDRTCRGIYVARGRTLEFFPDAACRALPLHRFVVGRAASTVLVLEAETTPARLGPEHGGGRSTVRVVMRLERA